VFDNSPSDAASSFYWFGLGFFLFGCFLLGFVLGCVFGVWFLWGVVGVFVVLGVFFFLGWVFFVGGLFVVVGEVVCCISMQ